MKEHKVIGMIAAAFTPMKKTGDIDLDKIPILTEHLIQQGVNGIYVCGSTGEGPSLTDKERQAVAETFINSASKRVPIFVHVGHNSVRAAKELASHAQTNGADFISAVPPAYYKIQSALELVRCLGDIACCAPELPFYYYHVPRLTNVTIDMAVFLELAMQKIPTFAGIKFTSPELHEYQACLKLSAGNNDILYGTDEMLLAALALGASGYIGSTYNFVPRLYQQLKNSFDNGDILHARDLQMISVDIVRVIVKFGGLRAQKAMIKLSGIDCGNVRSPLSPFTEEEEKLMNEDLKKIRFFDFTPLQTPKINSHG